MGKCIVYMGVSHLQDIFFYLNDVYLQIGLTFKQTCSLPIHHKNPLGVALIGLIFETPWFPLCGITGNWEVAITHRNKKNGWLEDEIYKAGDFGRWWKLGRCSSSLIFFNTRESLFIVTSDRHAEFPCWAILCCKNHVDVQTSSTAW